MRRDSDFAGSFARPESRDESPGQRAIAPGKRTQVDAHHVAPPAARPTAEAAHATAEEAADAGARAAGLRRALRSLFDLDATAGDDGQGPRGEAGVHARARRGVERGGAPLPYLDAIQASFGPQHDVSQIRAHVGGAAADAAMAIGAQAFATGEDVAFASPPDLHTAAHEAAHVVQQRRGVRLDGGVGAPDDDHEAVADAVADRVVAGEPSAELLGPAPASTGVARAAVQRKPLRTWWFKEQSDLVAIIGDRRDTDQLTTEELARVIELMQRDPTGRARVSDLKVLQQEIERRENPRQAPPEPIGDVVAQPTGVPSISPEVGDRIESLVGPLGAPEDVRGLRTIRNAPPELSRDDQARLARVKHFLCTLPVIRVGFDVAPNYGHQTASVATMQALRELGYEGWFEIYYQLDDTSNVKQSNRYKIAALMPGDFQLDGPRVQVVDAKRLRFIGIATKEAPTRTGTVGIMGANDHALDEEQRTSQRLNVEHALTLQPFEWHQARTVESFGRQQRLEPDRGSVDEMRRSPLAFQYDVSSPVDPFALVDELLASEPTKVENLKTLLRCLAAQRCELQAVYGLTDIEHELAALIDGIRWAQGQDGPAEHAVGGVVLAAIQPISDEFLPRGVDVVELDQEGAGERLARVTAGDLVVLRTGRLPKPLFDELYRLSTLPPVLEGANTTNFMRLTGLPYLNFETTKTPYVVPEVEDESDEKDYQQVLELLRTAETATRAKSPDRAQAVGRVMLEAKRPDSRLNDFFAAAGRQTRSAGNNMLVIGLDALRAAMEQQPPGLELVTGTLGGKRISQSIADYLVQRNRGLVGHEPQVKALVRHFVRGERDGDSARRGLETTATRALKDCRKILARRGIAPGDVTEPTDLARLLEQLEIARSELAQRPGKPDKALAKLERLGAALDALAGHRTSGAPSPDDDPRGFALWLEQRAPFNGTPVDPLQFSDPEVGFAATVVAPGETHHAPIEPPSTKTVWGNISSIESPGEGADGIIICDDRLVLKFLSHSAPVVFAEGVLEQLHVATPRSRVVRVSSEEGQQIVAMVRSKLEALGEKRQVAFGEQMEKRSYIEIMPRLDAKAMTKLDQGEIEQILASPDIITSIGKVAVVDIFLNNWDRVTRKQCNLGNFMVAQGSSGPTLIAIDNDARMNSDANDQQPDISFAVSEAGAKTLAACFLNTLTKSGTTYMPSDTDRARVERYFTRGILIGAQSLIAILSSERARSEMKRGEKRLPGDGGPRRLVRKSAKQRLRRLQDAYAAMIQNQEHFALEPPPLDDAPTSSHDDTTPRRVPSDPPRSQDTTRGSEGSDRSRRGSSRDGVGFGRGGAGVYDVLREHAKVTGDVPVGDRPEVLPTNSAPDQLDRGQQEGMTRTKLYEEGYGEIQQALARWLHVHGIAAIPNNGNGANNCLIISLLQLATAGRASEEQVARYKQLLVERHGIDDHMALDPTAKGFQTLVDAINKDCGTDLRVTYVQATNAEPPFSLLESDRGSQPVVVWDKLGHFEALVLT